MQIAQRHSSTLVAVALATVFAASAAYPLPAAAPSFGVFVADPRAALPALRSALLVLGQRAPSLRPDALGRDLGEPLGVDGLSVAELEAAGADVDKPIAIFDIDGALIACLRTKGTESRPRLEAWLGRRGAPGVTREAKAPVARSPQGAVVAGYALRANHLCVYAGGGDGAAAMKRAGELAVRPEDAKPDAKLATGLVGDVVLVIRDGPAAFALAASDKTVTLDCRVGRAALAPPASPDPYAAFRPEGIASAHATLSPKALTGRPGLLRPWLRWMLGAACGACPAATADRLVDRLVADLAGPVAVYVSGFLPPTGSMNTAVARYQSFRHAYVAAARDADKAAAAVAQIARAMRDAGVAVATDTAAGGEVALRVSLGAGSLLFGAKGPNFFIGNDVGAVTAALAAVGEPGASASSAVASVSLPALGRDLGRVSIVDIGRTPEIAPLFAVALELGSVMRGSGPLTATADPEDRWTRVKVQWSLPPPAPTP